MLPPSTTKKRGKSTKKKKSYKFNSIKMIN